MSDRTLPRGSTVLVTGVNSFIGSHIADQLLIDGYNVRGTVRTLTKGVDLLNHLQKTYGKERFDLIIVEDITAPNAFDEAIKGVADICHVATSAAFTTDASEAIPRTLAGALSILQSTANAPSVKTVVYTSDSFAVLLPQADKKVTITTSMYNEYAMEAMDNVVELDKVKANAWDPSVAIELVVWAAAKATAEKALWQFVADHRPSFQVATVIPNMNFGPPVDSQPLSSTGLCIPDLLKSEEKPNLYFPAQHFVHVRDCAKLHVAALLDPSQNGERIFACAAPFNWNDVLHILRDIKPDKSIRDDFQDLGRDVSVLPNDAAEQLLRKHYNHGWTSLKETVIQNIQHL